MERIKAAASARRAELERKLRAQLDEDLDNLAALLALHQGELAGGKEGGEAQEEALPATDGEDGEDGEDGVAPAIERATDSWGGAREAAPRNEVAPSDPPLEFVLSSVGSSVGSIVGSSSLPSLPSLPSQPPPPAATLFKVPQRPKRATAAEQRASRMAKGELNKLKSISSGLLLWAANQGPSKQYLQAELPKLLLLDPDQAHPKQPSGSDGALRCLADFGAALLMNRSARLLPSCAASAPMPGSGGSSEGLDLPDELRYHITAQLTTGDLLTTSLINKAWRETAVYSLQQRRLRRLASVGQTPQPSHKYFEAMIGCRVVVAVYYDVPRRWLPFSGNCHA